MNTTNMTHTKKHGLPLLLAAALAMLLPAACDKDIHENEYPLADGQGALVVGLESGAEVTGLALYLFGDDAGASWRATYGDPRALASGHIPLDAGTYTLIVVANVDEAALPRETTIPDLVEWLKAHAGDFPRMLTASGQIEVAAGDVGRLRLALASGASGVRLAAVRLSLALPGADLPAYAASRANAAAPLRCVAEVWQAGNRVHRRVQTCVPQADGTYLAELSLMPGQYDLRLWADRDGGHYDADDLAKVTILTDDYVANGETDEKDAFYAAGTLTVTGDAAEKRVDLLRPFARYRLVATDVEAYHNLVDKGEDLPDIDDLRVRVTYEGFFPTAFNVAAGVPNDALNTGIHYASAPTLAEGYDDAVNRQVGADFVLTNGEESFLTVTVEMIDTRAGEVVATVRNVRIPYRRGHLTTVTGHFLTAGKTTGGVQIDTEWDDIVIKF